MKPSRSKELGKGTYILILRLETDQELQIGSLGLFLFLEGFYAYVGSALGPGGLYARLKHHLRPPERPHWHIDYFREKARVVGILAKESQLRLEHQWACSLEKVSGATVPALGFGASDCKCNSHFFHFQEEPVLQGFGRSLPIDWLNGLR